MKIEQIFYFSISTIGISFSFKYMKVTEKSYQNVKFQKYRPPGLVDESSNISYLLIWHNQVLGFMHSLHNEI